MQITFTSLSLSGNRRCDNNPAGGGGSATNNVPMGQTSLQPQISTQSLRFKGFPKLPNIGNVVAETTQPPATQTQPTTISQPQQPTQPAESSEPDETPQTQTPQPEEPKTEDFETSWMKLVEALFKKKPAFYYQLKEYVPKLENDIIYVEVENEFQKNQIESSRQSMLEFWNENFSTKINGIELIIVEHEKKKIIYTNEDKVENMMEQNKELKDFLQVLNFRIKE